MGLPSQMDKLGEGISPEELASINKGTGGMTPRMIREMGEATAGLDTDSLMAQQVAYTKQIASRVEVPK